MAKIALSETTFSLCPEGTHIFQITAATYKADFGKLELTLKTKEGYTHIERFSFVKSDGSQNDVAINVFSFFAKTALQDFDATEVDHEELIGKFIKAEVTHDVVPNRNDPTKTITFSRLGNKYPANGYDDDDTAPVAPKKAPAAPTRPVSPAPTTPTSAAQPAAGSPKKLDLAAILGKK